MELQATRVRMAINQAHRAASFVPEAAEEHAAVGAVGLRPGYFGSRIAPLGTYAARTAASNPEAR